MVLLRLRRSSTLLNITLQDNGTISKGTIQKFSVVSDWIDRPADDRKILYKITAGLKPIEGNLELESDYDNYFLQEKPKYITLRRIDWEWKDQRYKAILALSAPVEPEKLKFFLTITQKKDNEKIALNYDLNVSSAKNTDYDFKYELTSNFQAGEEYTFTIKEGLLATDGAFNPDPLELVSNSPNLNNKLEFALNGSILSRHDLTKVPVVSVNIESFYITIEKIFASNLNHFINNEIDAYDISNIAKTISRENYQVEDIIKNNKIKNQEVVSHIDLFRLFRKNIYGLYRITISEAEYVHKRTAANSRWFLATDIGLVARRFGDNIVVWTNSLHSLETLPGCEVKVFDKWNQSIGNGYSDQEGFVHLKLDADSTPSHIVAKRGDDLSFLDMRKHKDKLNSYDIEGIPFDQKAIRTFIYSDRGVYRPGERVHLVAVTRGNEGTLSVSYPVTFNLINPIGNNEVSERYTLDEQGLYVYDFDVPDEAKTGKWQATALWMDKTIGNYTFQVEEFIPNKIKVSLKLLNKGISPGDTLKFKVKAKNLFGPPASGRRVTATVNLRANYFKPPNYSRFVFGNEDSQFQRIDEELPETHLDENGTYIYEHKIPEGINSPIGLSAHYSATVIDDGGRGVSNYATADILLYSQYVGIRRLTNEEVRINTPLGFEVVNVEADGSPLPHSQQKLTVRVYRNKLITHYRKNERGYYRYVTEKERILLDELNNPLNEENKFFYTPTYSGEHILEVEDLIGKQVTHYTFSVYGEEEKTQFVEAADKVQLTLLNSDIKVDDLARVEISTPFTGKVLIIGEREKILFTRVISMTKPKEIITIPVPSDYLPNFYISATALRPVQEGNRHDPIYAMGLLNINVRDRSHKPEIKLTVPKRVNPNSQMTVDLKISDTNNSEMYYTIAAVDVGILDLTNYTLPNMEGYFNQKRRLEVDHYSMYPLIMPYEPDVKYLIDPSGDEPSRALIKKKLVNPTSQQRVESVALWSGLLKTNTQGEGSVTFQLPDFDGTVRVMAVAYGTQRFASAKDEILVRDKLVLKPTLPRFLATGDDFIIPINLFNGTEQDDEIRVGISVSEHVKLRGPTSKTVHLPKNGEQALDFAIEVNNELGLAIFEITAEGKTETTKKIIKVPVRTPGTLLTKSGSGEIDQNTPKTVVLPKGFIEGTQELAMKITSNRLDQFQNSLAYLLQYPHGCLEQTTSKLFPLLYYSELAKTTSNIFDSQNTSHYYLREGIAKIERMQLENGAFSYWEGGSEINNWAFVYASHFLVEAQKAGMKISDTTWNNMIYYLNQMTSSSLEEAQLYNPYRGINHHLYALYVLALANENVLSQLNQVYDNLFDQFKVHDKARLAAAFAIAGVPDTAQTILQGLNLTSLSEYDNPYRETGGHFASDIRDLAIILDALTVIDPTSAQIPLLVDRLAEKTSGGRWGTTQENAFAFLAIGKALINAEVMRTECKITLGDKTVLPFDKEVLLKTPELFKGEVRIEVTGKGEVNYTWEAVGIEKKPQSLQQDEGLKIRRCFLDNKGEQVDLTNVRQGDLIVVEIKVQSLSSTLENVVVTDLLPTGLEIENARLSTSASLAWIKQDITPDYLDIRDDRINIFLRIPAEEKSYYYTTRAVTVGNFKVPAIRAEAMYDPNIFSKADDGQLNVLLKGMSEQD
ncbi:MAG: MG2 domain-containing protein [bacterium]